MAHSWTLEELAAMFGLSPRTIRSYIESDLIPGPDTLGRGARYSEKHRDRLRAIVALKDKPGLSLADIRQLLLSLNEDAILAVAGDQDVGEKTGAASEAPSGEAAAYLADLESRRRAPPRSRQGDLPHMQGPLNALLDQLEQLTPPGKFDRRARAEGWLRLQITPDVELHVRTSHLGREGRQTLERIAAHLRRVLMGT